MRIGIIGASGQVGCSVAYYLARSGVEVVCFTRSGRAEALFGLLGIRFERIEFDISSMKPRLLGLDAVLDFSYPGGQAHELKRELLANLAVVLSSMPPDSTFIYMSSIMAFGMDPNDTYLAPRLFSRTPYSRMKRLAEDIVESAKRRDSLAAYNLRLGQVHGVIQSISLSFKEALREQLTIRSNGRENDLTNTIFPVSICEAILACVRREVLPGTYTLVSSPQWTVRELYDYYSESCGVSTAIEFEDREAKALTPGSVLHAVAGAANAHRQLIEAYGLMYLPGIAVKLKGRFRVMEASRDGASSRARGRVRIHHHLLGPAPDVLPTKTSSRAMVLAAERKFEDELESLLDAARS
jgi:nucleoside-diphosphate-sugar epimerase